FNVGEKLVLAISDEVTICTTRGSIRFDAQGRHHLRSRQPVGSRIECLLRLTPDECRTIAAQARKLICPESITTIFNGEPLTSRLPLEAFNATLPTEVASADGLLRRAQRETVIRLFTPLPGETATLYEMGIPVVEPCDRWHYAIGQKVPLSPARQTLPVGFLR